MKVLSLLSPASPVSTEILIPGSKSYTIRALLLAAMTPSPVRLHSPLFSDDTLAMADCLNALGITTVPGDGWIDVIGDIRGARAGETRLDCNLSAATLRFLLALSAVIAGEQVLYGHEGLNRRPVTDLVDALRALGANIDYLERDGYPPVRVASRSFNTNRVQVAGTTSSQYLSALMMIAPLAGGLDIEVAGELISQPYVAMTMDIMRRFGVDACNEDFKRLTVPAGQAYQADEYTVEPDASSAAYFLAMAALNGSQVRIPGLPADSKQADLRFAHILADMGNELHWKADTLVFQGCGVKALRVDMRDCPDQAQTLAVLAAFADGPTRIEGLQSLRVKETDRIAAVAAELAKMGIRVDAEADAMTIHGGQPSAARIATYGDHRMAMAFAVAGVRVPGLEIEEPGVVGKTFPNFWEVIGRMGLQAKQDRASERNKVILIGFMGAGKSHIAPLLAEKLGYRAVEMDALVTHRAGRKSISEIFDKDGETRFREIEIETAKSLRHQAQAVIATGGGIIMNKIAVDYLSETGTIVFLDAALNTVLSRVDISDRPLLKDGRVDIASLYELRYPLYKHYAQVHVRTDGKTEDQVVDEILEALASRDTSYAGSGRIPGGSSGLQSEKSGREVGLLVSSTQEQVEGLPR